MWYSRIAMSLVSVDPTSNKTIRSYPEDSVSELTRKMDAAAAAFSGWRSLSFAGRARHILALGEVIAERQQEFAVLMAQEMGKHSRKAVPRSRNAPWHAGTSRSTRRVTSRMNR
jgi:succinate-semialdehyde dehydrogenase / glutarate-semialdehyde dehydrogenase